MTPFYGWNNFMLYLHPQWQTGLIDVGCRLGYTIATASEEASVKSGQLNKVIKHDQDCLTPAYFAFQRGFEGQ